jgi:hypothetical protein
MSGFGPIPKMLLYAQSCRHAIFGAISSISWSMWDVIVWDRLLQPPNL